VRFLKTDSDGADVTFHGRVFHGWVEAAGDREEAPLKGVES